MSDENKISKEKETLRQEAIRHRERMTLGIEDPEKTVAHFFSLFEPDSFDVLAGYWPKGREFDTIPILEEVLKKGKKCALPLVKKGTRLLDFVQWEEGQPLIKGAFDVKCPVVNDKTVYLTPDIVLVPMLAFDRRGYRLGYGGGYYDYTLAHLRASTDKKIIAVGLAYSQQACLFPLPCDEHDEKLDFVITPQGVHYFS